MAVNGVTLNASGSVRCVDRENRADLPPLRLTLVRARSEPSLLEGETLLRNHTGVDFQVTIGDGIFVFERCVESALSSLF